MSVLGTFVSRFDVERATLSTVAYWLETYLSDLETQQGIPAQSLPRPPAPNLNDLGSVLGSTSQLTEGEPGEPVDIEADETPTSYRGGLDTASFNEGELPGILVMAQPVGNAARHGSGDYFQSYEIEISAVIEDGDEDRARWIADLYGAALMALVVQNGQLGGLADTTTLLSAPKTELLNPEIRRLVISTVTVESLVTGIVNDLDGLGSVLGVVPAPTENPPAAGPEVTSVDLTFTAEPVGN